MDLTAEFYLQTVEKVFVDHALPKGEMMHRDEPVDLDGDPHVAPSWRSRARTTTSPASARPRRRSTSRRTFPAEKAYHLQHGGRPLRRLQRLALPHRDCAAHRRLHRQHGQLSGRRSGDSAPGRARLVRGTGVRTEASAPMAKARGSGPRAGCDWRCSAGPSPDHLDILHEGETLRVLLRAPADRRRLTLRVSSATGESRDDAARRAPRSCCAGPSPCATEDGSRHGSPACPRACRSRRSRAADLRGVPRRVLHRDRRSADSPGSRVLAAEPVLSVACDAPHIARRITDFLQREARRDLTEAVARYTEELGQGPRASPCATPGAAGAPAPSHGELNFSWRLILAPPLVLDYLAAHEVGHLRGDEPLARFWTLVGSLCPHVDEAERWLKRNGADPPPLRLRSSQPRTRSARPRTTCSAGQVGRGSTSPGFKVRGATLSQTSRWRRITAGNSSRRMMPPSRQNPAISAETSATATARRTCHRTVLDHERTVPVEGALDIGGLADGKRLCDGRTGESEGGEKERARSR